VNYRVFSLPLLCLAAVADVDAAVPTQFALLDANPSIVWSVTPLHKGDVLEVHAFKAAPGTTVMLGICNDKCDNVHVVKSISVSRPTSNSVSEKYVLEENGHLALWTAQPPRSDLHANPAADSRTGGGGASNEEKIQSGATGAFSAESVMPIRKSEIDADQIKVRFDGGCYITLNAQNATREWPDQVFATDTPNRCCAGMRSDRRNYASNGKLNSAMETQ
jgi:hypothetical protein